MVRFSWGLMKVRIPVLNRIFRQTDASLYILIVLELNLYCKDSHRRDCGIYCRQGQRPLRTGSGGDGGAGSMAGGSGAQGHTHVPVAGRSHVLAAPEACRVHLSLVAVGGITVVSPGVGLSVPVLCVPNTLKIYEVVNSGITKNTMIKKRK